MSSSLSLEEWRDLELPDWPHKSMLSKTCHLLSETLTAYPACPLQHKLQMPTTLTRVGPGLTMHFPEPPKTLRQWLSTTTGDCPDIRPCSALPKGQAVNCLEIRLSLMKKLPPVLPHDHHHCIPNAQHTFSPPVWPSLQ